MPPLSLRGIMTCAGGFCDASQCGRNLPTTTLNHLNDFKKMESNPELTTSRNSFWLVSHFRASCSPLPCFLGRFSAATSGIGSPSHCEDKLYHDELSQFASSSCNNSMMKLIVTGATGAVMYSSVQESSTHVEIYSSPFFHSRP